MRIESRSLSAYLQSQGVEWEGDVLRDKWKEILMFPDEDWIIKRNSVLGQPCPDDKQANLDPARVLARMLCVKIDRALTSKTVVEKLWRKVRKEIDIKRKKISTEEKDIPISWLLRIAERKKIPWDPGDFLIFACLKGGPRIYSDFKQIRKYFPELFADKTLSPKDFKGKESDKHDSVRKITEIFRQTYPEFLSRDLIHISAPKFHKIWSAMINDEDLEKKKDTQKAKQQWSMKINATFERICKNSIPKETVMLQSGGGHVLLLAPNESENDRFSKNLLKKMADKFSKEAQWSPLLASSWHNGHHKNWSPELSNNVNPEDIIDNLKKEYEESELSRKLSAQYWAAFQYGSWGSVSGQEGETLDLEENKLSTFYLDVMGLGDYCWPKPQNYLQTQTPQTVENNPEQWNIPERPRKSAVEGFCNSRKITPVIESTFGLIYAKHRPTEVKAMGGDEIIFQMPTKDWTSLLDSVERHCVKMHSSTFDNKQRLLWWAICMEPDLEGDFTAMKDVLRRNMQENEYKLTRFVNPIFPKMVDDVW